LKDEGREAWLNIPKRWLDGLERSLNGREWTACKEFTVADILLATVLREVRKTDLMALYPHLKEYYARALARPAWERTLGLYAERLGVPVADIR
jgi:glutathione S-transferase